LGFHNIDYRVMDAERMDLDDDSVDRRALPWGYIGADPRSPLARLAGALRPGWALSFRRLGRAPQPWGHAGRSGSWFPRGLMPPPEKWGAGDRRHGRHGRVIETLTSAGFEVAAARGFRMTGTLFEDSTSSVRLALH